ncbi:MAG TPA: chemotaxis protein CheB [Thermoanaerobaculia bacterium]|nr:chemotaxis protein CheB [Thermoanaerobaculia bacterium]
MLTMHKTPQVPGSTERIVPRVVALAASAGGIQALSHVLAALPPGFPAAVVVLQHLSEQSPHVMADIFARRSVLPVAEARAGDVLTPGRVFVAPPGRHLLVEPEGILALSDALPVHFVRPAADLLFASLAESLGTRAIAVVLSGSGLDGADGVKVIKGHGGRVLVQDRATSEVFGMPRAAADTGCADRVLPLQEIAPVLIDLVGQKEEA